MTPPLLEVRNLSVVFPGRRRLLGRRSPAVRALDDVSLAIAPGETLGLVGESGSGKTTLGRAVLGLVRPTAGSITFLGRSLTGRTPAIPRQLRPDLQVVFQNPYSSLNPALRVVDIIGEPLAFHRKLRDRALGDAVDHLLRRVGIPPEYRHRFPDQFSGGQRQRIAIARAIALEPKLIICDEATSGLDVSTRNQIIGLLEDLREQLGIAYLFIGHDLALVRHISHRIAVMYGGRAVETGDADQVCDSPRHPYTARLISAIPVPDPEEQAARRRSRSRASSSISAAGGAVTEDGRPLRGRC
jgi:ABC-type oligopeptide transport system ATPase subunit